MSSLEHGTKYEEYVKQFLSNKYKNIWLWHEIPINILHSLKIIPADQITCDDIGCDILGETNDNQYHFIQCKNYSTIGIDNVISICDLAGFYNFMAEHNFINGIVYYSGMLSSQVVKRSKSIKYINLPYNTCSVIKLTPYSYQIDAYNKLSNYGRHILTMPCGTGKTYVSYLISAKYKNIIILSPLISTAEQLYLFYKNYYINNETQNISIFNCMSKSKNINLQKNNVIISTYDSVKLILDKVDKLQDKIIIIDEYHNLSNNNITNSSDYINKLLNLTNTSYLFMSATPHKLKTQYVNIFGNNEYILNWQDAINNKYICDYKFYYPNPDTINIKITGLRQNTIISSLEIQKCVLLNKAYYLLECIATLKVKKIIVFLKTIVESTEFCKIIKLLNTFFNNKLVVNEINCNVCKSERTKIMSRFKNKNDTINILCNVHILDEGIDIPECDSVYLTHPNHNPINFIQRISRCNRINKLDTNKSSHVLIWAKNQNKIIQIDNLISEYINIKPVICTENEYIRGIKQPIEQNNNASNNINVEQVNTNKNSTSYIALINYLTTSYNLTYITDKQNEIWISYDKILNILGYTDIKNIKSRITIDENYFRKFSQIYCLSGNNHKLDYQKPNEIYICEKGLLLLLNLSTKTEAKKLYSIFLENNIEPQSSDNCGLLFKTNQHYIKLITDLKTYKNTTYDNNNDIWFSLSDIYRYLGYPNPNVQIKRLNLKKDYIKKYIDLLNNIINKPEKTKNAQPHTKMTNELGLNVIILKSNKSIAQKIKESYNLD